MNLWLNIVGFQLVWTVTVAGAGRGLWWLGMPVLLVFAAWQCRVSKVPVADLKLVVIAAVLGFAIDSVFASMHWLQYASPRPWPLLAPVWIVVLWMGFALTLNHSMHFLRGRLVLAVLFGAVGGPVAYIAADRLWGAVRFDTPGWPALLALGLAWAVVTPVLVASAMRLARDEEAVA